MTFTTVRYFGQFKYWPINWEWDLIDVYYFTTQKWLWSTRLYYNLVQWMSGPNRVMTSELQHYTLYLGIEVYMLMQKYLEKSDFIKYIPVHVCASIEMSLFMKKAPNILPVSVK